eukprot:350467-Chlamydomonas_euryale.AAC.7
MGRLNTAEPGNRVGALPPRCWWVVRLQRVLNLQLGSLPCQRRLALGSVHQCHVLRRGCIIAIASIVSIASIVAIAAVVAVAAVVAIAAMVAIQAMFGSRVAIVATAVAIDQQRFGINSNRAVSVAAMDPVAAIAIAATSSVAAIAVTAMDPIASIAVAAICSIRGRPLLAGGAVLVSTAAGRGRGGVL